MIIRVIFRVIFFFVFFFGELFSGDFSGDFFSIVHLVCIRVVLICEVEEQQEEESTDFVLHQRLRQGEDGQVH